MANGCHDGAVPSSWRAALLRARAASFLSLLLGMMRLARLSALARCSSEDGTIGMAWKAPVGLAACQQTTPMSLLLRAARCP